MTSADPFYNRRPVPDALVADVGFTNLTPQQEYLNRERKYSLADGSDARKFTNPTINLRKGSAPGTAAAATKAQSDPFYTRKPIPGSLIADVATDTGLTPEQAHWTRERKYSLADGSDARKFSNKLTPVTDPFYGRKPVSDAEITGVGETGRPEALDYTVRERKQSVFQLSNDPFAEISGKGHRASVVTGLGTKEAERGWERRRSSAVAPHHLGQANGSGAGHSGGAAMAPGLEKIESRMDDEDGINAEGSGSGSGAAAGAGAGDMPPVHDRITEGETISSGKGRVGQGHVQGKGDYEDPDSVAPHEMR